MPLAVHDSQAVSRRRVTDPPKSGGILTPCNFKPGRAADLDSLLIVVSVASLAAAVGAAYFGYRALLPQKRELVVSAQPPVALLGEMITGAGVGTVDVLIDGKSVDSQSRVVVVTIQNTGRFDIAPSHYANGEGVTLQLGAEVEKILSVSVDPERGTAPEFAVVDAGLVMRPAILGREQVVSAQLLLTGDEPVNLEASHDLVDVEVKVAQRPRQLKRGAALRGAISFTAAGATAILSLIAFVYLLSQGPSVSISPNFVQPGDSMRLTGEGFDAYVVIKASMEDSNYDSVELGETQADSDGNFSIVVAVPASVEGGPYEVTVSAKGHDSTQFVYADVDVATSE